MRVLGIESSCDETGVAVYDSKQGLMGEALYSQIALHAQYGGVVPELASRDHIRKILPLVDKVLQQSAMPNLESRAGSRLQLGPRSSLATHNESPVDAVAFTAGPGLVGALLVGASVAQSLAYGWGVPAIGIHHMEGHLLSALLVDKSPSFPFLALLVSGGHTQLVDVRGLGQYQVLGQSLDDAVGEAFDKTAKLMGLPYPGGPQLAALAEHGDAHAFDFPRPMLNKPGLDFSYSGLKTSVLLVWEDSVKDDQIKANIAASFEQAVVDTLITKVQRALEVTQYREVVIAGGVGANRQLRVQLEKMARQRSVSVFFPPPHLCTDNGAMIAYAGWMRLHNKIPINVRHNEVRARWSLEDLAQREHR